MSSDAPAISVRGLSKEYVLGQYQARTTLSQAVSRYLRLEARRSRGRERFQALDDVSFEVARGTALGIIGRNGAGKSTLLKILSRITKPTRGEIRIRGRVGSLLEVGTGFHPELTGRENIFMNGAILGMRRSEIVRKFDEIVAFAEVERFLDTPVKRYSSGMYVRLAFAVAAHLEPEILLVDEVLAVGDAEFQKKCLGKMGQVAGDGRTVLFVSHNTAAVQQLTSAALLLDGGTVAYMGTTGGALERYHRLTGGTSHDVCLDSKPRQDDQLGLKARLLHARIVGGAAAHLASDESPVIDVTYVVNRSIDVIRLAYTVHRFDGTPIGTAWATDEPAPGPGAREVRRVVVKAPTLAPGGYYLALGLGRGNERTGPVEYDVVMETVHFTVDPTPTQDGTVASWSSNWGSFRLPDPSTSPVSKNPSAATP